MADKILSDMCSDDLNMYYGDTFLSIIEEKENLPFFVHCFSYNDSEDRYVAEGLVYSRNSDGTISRSGLTVDIGKLATSYPAVGYVKVHNSFHWLQHKPVGRSYKKGLQPCNLNCEVDRDIAYQLYNTPYTDYIIDKDMCVFYKGNKAGELLCNDNEKLFIPLSEDYEYLEDYINEEINR